MSSLPIVFGYHINALGNSSVPYALCRHWNRSGLATRLLGPSCESQFTDDWLQVAMGRLTRKLVYRFGRPETVRNLAEKLAIKQSRESAFVYLWAGLSLQLFRELKKQGKTLIVERINCHQATARKILDRAGEEYGLPPGYQITEESIAEETAKLALADAIFCPSPMVYRSLLDNGVEENKLLATSYGWAPERFLERQRLTEPGDKPTFLFVGTLCLRKGVPLLLAAWDEAAIDGRLIFCGQMEKNISDRYGHYFDRPDIHYVPYSPDLSKYYRRADFFVFPSLEEGGPMVTYEAMAHGLLPLVSEMGAGAIVEDRKNGLVLPLSVSRWAEALRAVAENRARSGELAHAASLRAAEFTWERVAERRARLLLARFPKLWQQEMAVAGGIA